jgi:hypothetical protein
LLEKTIAEPFENALKPIDANPPACKRIWRVQRPVRDPGPTGFLGVMVADKTMIVATTLYYAVDLALAWERAERFLSEKEPLC